MRSQQGFTLIELMIVVVLIAVASSIASLALRDPASTTLEREGARLGALLEGARSEARSSGLAAYWEPRTENPEVPGFRFRGLPPSSDLPSGWLEDGVSAEVVGARAVVLGPEPLIPAQKIVLRFREQRLVLATDGLGLAETIGELQKVLGLQRLAAEHQHVRAVQRVAHLGEDPVGQWTRQIDSADFRPHAGVGFAD